MVYGGPDEPNATVRSQPLEKIAGGNEECEPYPILNGPVDTYANPKGLISAAEGPSTSGGSNKQSTNRGTVHTRASEIHGGSNAR